MEEWRSIPGLPGYEASSEGRIRTIEHRILKQEYGGRNTDYPRVTISAKRTLGFSKRFTVHALVAKAFLGECPAGLEHNHKDGDKSNARPENLEFVTRSQNQQHSVDVLGKPSQQGMKHGMARLTDTDVITIHGERLRGASLADLSRRFGIGQPTVSMICRGRIWKHLGLKDLGRFQVTPHGHKSS